MGSHDQEMKSEEENSQTKLISDGPRKQNRWGWSSRTWGRRRLQRPILKEYSTTRGPTVESDDPARPQLIEILISSFDQKLEKFSANSSNSYAACLYRVSNKLRMENEAAYTPRLVSIGPLHHDRAQLQGMEAYKLKFMNNFVRRFRIDPHALVKFAAGEESFVRGCYEGKIHLSRRRLSEVILLDGIFIVELFLENHFVQLRDANEIIFAYQNIYNDLLHDILLLENQLPIRIMKSLLNFVDLSSINEDTCTELTILDLAHKFFANVGNTQKVPVTKCYGNARHFVEFLHANTDEKPGLLHDGKGPSPGIKFEKNRCATELHEAGVKFHGTNGYCLFEILFDKENGVLLIPKLTVNASTDTFFRNLVAFEHLVQFGNLPKNITSYVILMDNLIDTSGDVDILVSHGIIENKLGDSQQVADLFNNLYKEVVTEANAFYFAGLCIELNEYHKDRLHQWRATWFRWRAKWFTWFGILKKNYFSNPWSSLSVIAAIVLLILTLIQTVCSVLQV